MFEFVLVTSESYKQLSQKEAGHFLSRTCRQGSMSPTWFFSACYTHAYMRSLTPTCQIKLSFHLC
jgi:hypothetical protein